MPDEMRRESFFHPARGFYRYSILFFVSLLTFGSYFAYDSIGALANTLIRKLGMKPSTIGTLYSAYSVAAIIIVLLGGILIDRLGTRRASLLFSFLVLLGAVIVAGAKSTFALFVGRFIFGAGSESLIVAQLSILSKWFKGKELAMSFGVSLTISRLGTLISFNTEAQIAAHYDKLGKIGYKYALWAAALLCLFSLLANLAYWVMDVYGDRRLSRQDVASTDKIVFSDITSFKSSYWYVTLLCLTFYSAIFPFTALSTNLFAEKWRIPDVEAHGGGFFPSIFRGAANHFHHPNALSVVLGISFLALIFFLWIPRDKVNQVIKRVFLILSVLVFILCLLLPGFSSLLRTAPGMTSIIIFASMMFAPFAGKMMDWFGHRASIMVVGCLILIPCHLVLGVTNIYPAYPMIFLGIAFILVPAALWPSITLSVPKEKVGTAFGLTTMIQNIGLMLFPILNGKLHDWTNSYQASQVMFSLLGVMGLVFAILLIRSDRRAGNILEKP